MIDSKIKKSRSKRVNKHIWITKPIVTVAFIKVIFTKIFWKTIFELCFTYYVLKFRKYYTHIDYLPLFNFAEIMKGKLNYLYIGKIYKRVPKVVFAKVFQEMNFQFKKLDNKHLRQLADLADFESKYVRTGNKRWLNEYNTLKNKIEKKKRREFDLNSFTDYIERTYNLVPGAIDVHKISTAKAFMSYQKAIKHNKNKE